MSSKSQKASLRKADGSILWLQIFMSEILVQWEFCVREAKSYEGLPLYCPRAGMTPREMEGWTGWLSVSQKKTGCGCHWCEELHELLTDNDHFANEGQSIIAGAS